MIIVAGTMVVAMVLYISAMVYDAIEKERRHREFRCAIRSNGEWR